jgi:hypothetical protein
MFRARFLAGVIALAVLTGGWLLGDDTKKGADDEAAPPPKTPVGYTLPAGMARAWKQLAPNDCF